MASFLIPVILCLATLCVCRADLVSEICAKSTNPALCALSLRPDLKGLGQIAATKAITATQGVIAVAKTKSGGPASTCVETSGNAIADLQECVNYLKSSARSSIGDLRTKASAALTNVGTCDDEFGSSEPADLKAATKKAENLIKELLVIANKL